MLVRDWVLEINSNNHQKYTNDMAQNDKKVAELIQSIAHKKEHKHRFPVMSGTVVSISESEMTAVVQLNIDDDGVHTENVSINVALQQSDGMYGIPAADSLCLVAEVDGPRRWELLKASEYAKVVIKAGTSIQFNDGSLGGLVELEKLKTNLSKIHDYIKNTLEPGIKSGINGVGAGTAASGSAGAAAFDLALIGQDILFDNMENTKIKQG